MQIKAGSKVIRITPSSVLEIGKEYRINTVKLSRYDGTWFTLEGFGDTLFHSDFFKLDSAEPSVIKTTGKFKRGDFVVCKQNTHNEYLTVGKIYEVLEVAEGGYFVEVLRDDNIVETCFANRFELLNTKIEPTLAEAKQLRKQAEQNISEYIQKIMQEFQTNSGILDAKLTVHRFEFHAVSKPNPEYVYEVSIEAKV